MIPEEAQIDAMIDRWLSKNAAAFEKAKYEPRKQSTEIDEVDEDNLPDGDENPF